MPNELQPPTGAAPLTAMLRQVAFGVAEAQRALDAFAEAQIAANPEANLPAVAFCFPGLNEQIAPQNLSQLHMRLRPIPKDQQNAPQPNTSLPE